MSEKEEKIKKTSCFRYCYFVKKLLERFLHFNQGRVFIVFMDNKKDIIKKDEKTKLKISYLTIFPNYFENYFQNSIQRRAINFGILKFKTYNLRDFAEKGKVDDYQYGGGEGMVIKIDPLVKAIKKFREDNKFSYVILLNPQARVFSQKDVKRLVEKKNIAFVCGHYEGVDCRVSSYVDEEISVGEFITMGGEIPALLISESLIRAVSGVIKQESFQKETFHNNSFDYDCYTRPSDFEGLKVPDVLLSGNHQKIKNWREINSLKKKSN